MLHHFEWLYEDKIAFITLSGEFSSDVADDYLAVMQNFLNESSQPKVHFIEDLSQVTKARLSMREAGRIGKDIFDHDRMGWLIAYGLQSKSTSFIVNMLTQVFRQHVRSVRTFEEATQVLKRLDFSLPDLSDIEVPQPKS